MSRHWKLLFASVVVVALAACATPQTPEEAPVEEAVVEPAEELPPDPLADPGVAYFRTETGQRVQGSVTLPTGGPPAGRLIPSSDNQAVTLYLTRDGSVPSSANNWGGAVSPASARPISRPSEGTATYRVVAELEGRYSEPVSVVIAWRNEENPVLAAPRFLVDGAPRNGSIELPVSDGSIPAARLYIESDYIASTLYITRDGSEPSPDNFWKSQLAAGTYLFSPEETGATYRAVAVWQNARSPVAQITVEWAE